MYSKSFLSHRLEREDTLQKAKSPHIAPPLEGCRALGWKFASAPCFPARFANTVVMPPSCGEMQNRKTCSIGVNGFCCWLKAWEAKPFFQGLQKNGVRNRYKVSNASHPSLPLTAISNTICLSIWHEILNTSALFLSNKKFKILNFLIINCFLSVFLLSACKFQCYKLFSYSGKHCHHTPPYFTLIFWGSFRILSHNFQGWSYFYPN